MPARAKLRRHEHRTHRDRSHRRPNHRRPLCHVPTRELRIVSEYRAGSRPHRVSPGERDARSCPRRRLLRPAQPVGEIVRELLHLGDDPRERPFPDRDRMRLRRWRKRAQHHVDTWRFILAVPCGGKASGETHAARAVLRRDDPNHGATCPGETTQEECIRLLQRRGDIGGENRVMPAGRDVGCIPAAGDGAGRIIEACKPRCACEPRARSRSIDSPASAAHVRAARPRRRRRADRRSRRRPGGRAVQRARRSRRCRYRLHTTRSDRSVRMRRRRRPGSRDWAADRGQDQSRRARRYLRQRSRHRELPPLAPYRFTVRCDRSGNIRTPRLLRPRVTPAVAGLLARGSSPPTTFPRTAFSVALWSEARRLQLRGQPRRCAQAHAPRSLLIPCGNHRRPSCRARTIASTSLTDATAGL